MRSFVLLLFPICACGGRLGAGDAGADDDAAPEGGRYPRLPDGGAWVDPRCPDSGPPPVDVQCDVLDPIGTCKPGTACFPVTLPPQGPCDTERYGAVCAMPGTGKQGDPCGEQGQACAAGYVCVITGAATECAKACRLGDKSACPSGAVCEPIDVPGYAVCL